MILSMMYGAMLFAQPMGALGPDAASPPPTTLATPVRDASTPIFAPSSIRLPALTPLRLRVVGAVSSSTHVAGDKIVIALAEPLRVSDTLAIPAGILGVGEVIHSAKGGMGGKAGELLIAARSLDLSADVHIPLRSFRLTAVKGSSKEGLAMGLTVAGGVAGGIAAMVITGGAASIADGSEAFAKTAADIDLPLALLLLDQGAPPAPQP